MMEVDVYKIPIVECVLVDFRPDVLDPTKNVARLVAVDTQWFVQRPPVCTVDQCPSNESAPRLRLDRSLTTNCQSAALKQPRPQGVADMIAALARHVALSDQNTAIEGEYRPIRRHRIPVGVKIRECLDDREERRLTLRVLRPLEDDPLAAWKQTVVRGDFAPRTPAFERDGNVVAFLDEPEHDISGHGTSPLTVRRCCRRPEIEPSALSMPRVRQDSAPTTRVGSRQIGLRRD